MPRIDILDLVSAVGEPAGRPRVLSSGCGWPRDFLEQLISAHEGWGAPGVQAPDMPVVSSLRIQPGAMPGSGNHYAVSVTWGAGGEIKHRCLLVHHEDYIKAGFHPYLLLAEQAGMLLEGVTLPQWEDGHAPDTATCALVTDGLQRLLQRGELHLPLSQPESGCDRILALLLTLIPVRTRAQLRFTSFSPGEPWLWNLAAVRQPGGSLVDWKRRVMDLSGYDIGPEAGKYLREARTHLAAGDLKGLNSLARRTRFQPSLGGGRHSATAGPDQGGSRIGLRPRGTATAPVARSEAPPRIGTSTAASVPVAEKAGSAGKRRPGGQASQQPMPVLSSRHRPRIVLERRRLRPVSMPDPRRNRRLPARVVTTLVFLGVLAGGWLLGGVPGLSVDSLIHKLTPAWDRQDDGPAEAPLLAVVDVGKVYEEILTRNQTGILEGGSLGEKSRRKAVAQLRREAARPLAGQIAAYFEVAEGGIRTSPQPGRESRRLDILASEGRDLGGDLDRLSLAWYSLSRGICWQDLGVLPDGAVMGRCDSLDRVDGAWRASAASDLGMGDLHEQLAAMVRETDAMGRLVDLFQAGTWSAQWQRDLLAAAGAVPPAASPVTRAYRNAAFVLARLKDAEHAAASRDLPFGAGWSEGGWPSAAVREVLPALRRVTGMFRQGRAPVSLASAVGLYAMLEDPRAAAERAAADPEFWRAVNANPAVAFDPGVYEDILGRVRFEALRPYLDRGDPASAWPGHLTTLAAAPMLMEFHGLLAMDPPARIWRREEADLTDAFLRRWAERKSRGTSLASRARQAAFDGAWRTLIADLDRVNTLARANRNWSEAWLALQASALDLLNRYVLAFEDDPVARAQMVAASNLLDTMARPLDLRVLGARVDLERVPVGAVPVLEAVVMPAGRSVGRRELVAADGFRDPVDVPLGWSFSLDPSNWLVLKVVDRTTGGVILEATCPSLQEGAGPAAMSSPLEGEGGSVALTLGPNFWRQLELPDLGGIF